MSEREAAFVRFVDLMQEKQRIELELRLREIDRELDLTMPPRTTAAVLTDSFSIR